MADWNIDWKPSSVQPYEFGSQFKTLVTELGNGAEQRRKKWSRKKHGFTLSFNALPVATVHAIRAFFDARSGSYEPFNFPNYAQKISGSGLALNENGAGADTITDSDSGFVAMGFNDNLQVCVNGSATSANDGHYALTTVAAGTLTIPAASLTADDSANAALEVYCSYSVRFMEDQFRNGFLTPALGNVRTIELVEVI